MELGRWINRYRRIPFTYVCRFRVLPNLPEHPGYSRMFKYILWRFFTLQDEYEFSDGHREYVGSINAFCTGNKLASTLFCFPESGEGSTHDCDFKYPGTRKCDHLGY